MKQFENLQKLEDILQKSSFCCRTSHENLLPSLELESIFYNNNISKKQLEEKIKANQQRVSLKEASALYLDNLLNKTENSNKNIDGIEGEPKESNVSQNFEEHNKIYKIYKKEIKHMNIDPEEEEMRDEADFLPHESSAVLIQSFLIFKTLIEKIN